MRKQSSLLLGLLSAALALTAVLSAAPAVAAFGFKDLSVSFTNFDGSPATQAGSHPYAFTTNVGFLTRPESGLPYEVPDGDPRNLTVAQIPGLVADPTAVPRCSTVDYLDKNCPPDTQVGVSDVVFMEPTSLPERVKVFNLTPPSGAVLKFGFHVLVVPITLEATLSTTPPYNGVVTLNNIPATIPIYNSKVTIWGVPADPRHNAERGCGSNCPASEEKPLLTLPRACEGVQDTIFEGVSWQQPDALAKGIAPTAGLGGCAKLGFSPKIIAQPTSRAARSPSALDFTLEDGGNEGLTDSLNVSNADIEKAVVTLPEGFTTNPSLAEGLEVCTTAQLDAESVDSPPGAGCPNASKIGTVEVETPLLEENVNGSVFVAEPFKNEFNSLLALYVVLKNPQLGIMIKQAAKIESDPVTGQLRTITDNMPQLPFSHLRLRLREGTRSPLATPPGCGTYNAKAELTPSAGGAPITTTSAFEIITGPNGAPCPSGGVPPFRPNLNAGTINNAAGHYSPFNLRLSRNDSEQEFTHFSIKLPPGITGKLAGIPFCPDAAIAAAKARTGPLGGQEELALPSCPAASEVGRTLAGAGVGPSLAYAAGKVYLAGPYNGSQLSIAAVTAAKVGPFDLGTVVVRQALRINPETAEVFIDATGSDPLPHIIQGIPVHLRDIRAYVNKPEFVLNPTNCKRTSTASTVLGSGLNFGSAADDQPVTVTTPFQAADCASLGFKPRLSLRLKGGVKRGDHPALRAVLRPKVGDANSAKASVQLPHSEFLEQSHIRTVCTRVQFAAGKGNGTQCPAGSVYGRAKAWTPLLSDPLEGPLILRSSSNPLPDIVLALRGLIDFNAIGRIDSVDGGIRNTFDFIPDAPITKVVVDFQGGKKGLLVNSTNICRRKHHAVAKFTGQNGKIHHFNPALKASCGKKRKGAKG